MDCWQMFGYDVIKLPRIGHPYVRNTVERIKSLCGSLESGTLMQETLLFVFGVMLP
jgi:hypothetical protein